jgi:nucleotide-binding universal stress UspA family protein
MIPVVLPGSVLVAVDGSESAERALIRATEEARLQRRPLVVVTAGDGDSSVNADAVRRARESAPEIEVGGLTAPGDPRGSLIDLSYDAHLLVVGSRGRGALRTRLLGSVSAMVSQLSSCPVVVCRPHAPEGRAAGVLVGADGTPESLAVIEFAFEQASLHRRPLTVVHCVWDVVAAVAALHDVPVDEIESGTHDDLYLMLSESVAGFAEKYPDVPVTLRVAYGLIDDVLGARSTEWDLVVVGRHPLDSIGRLVTGSVAHAVVERSRTNVAVVPTERARIAHDREA